MLIAYSEDLIKLDPRTEILLLVIVNIVAFTQSSLYIEISLILFLAIVLVTCKCYKPACKWCCIFGLLLILQYIIFPISPQIISGTFAFLSLYFRKIIPCLMIGNMILKITPVRHFIFALQRWHLPQAIIIPLSITIRYFPAIREEVSHIKDAIKLRNISGVEKIECYLVPLMISATNTAEELSAAAVTRGIENPVANTSIIDLKFSIQDYICLTVGLGFIIMTFIVSI